MTDAMADAVAALGPEPLDESAVARHIFPLFSKVLAFPGIYLANHSLGRPLDQSGRDVAEAFELWQTKLGMAWEGWLDEREAFRSRVARLINAPRSDCVVPKTSAGQGLRTVLNALPGKPRVVSTRGEFDSVDLILKQYAALGRIQICWTDISIDELTAAATAGADLVIVSHVMFADGQVMHGLDQLAALCHRAGARLLIDAYHSIGVFPVDVAALGADFMIGGSYKYLRGGPGACFLYLSPETLASGLTPLDTGWFAKRDAFLYRRPDPPQFAPGGDAFLESTPPIMTYYQARAGQRLALVLGVNRIRQYSIDRLARLKRYLAESGVESQGADADHGAFLTVHHSNASALASDLAARGVYSDARGPYLRLCPDLLSTNEELVRAAHVLAQLHESITMAD